MTKIDKPTILNAAAKLYARHGYDNFNIRRLAKEIRITHSVMYHYFANQDDILKAMFDHTNTQLGTLRDKLPPTDTASEMLKQRIEFQIDHAEKIVAVLKYYLMNRTLFKKNGDGYLPDKSALHIEEVLEKGVATGEFQSKDILDDSKVITHAINGFLLEYYPHTPRGKEKEHLIDKIYTFLIRALKGGETYEQ